MSEEEIPKKNELVPSEAEIETFLKGKTPDVFAGLTEEKKRELVTSVRDMIYVEVRQESSRFIGPLPPPEYLEHYQKIDPNFAKNIIQMAINEQTYAHSRDDKIIESSFRVKRRGQNFALVIALVAIIGGITCILFDYEIGGTIVSGVGLSGLISEFIGREKSASSDLNHKEETD